jgi:CHAT domain-containing protein
MKHFGRFLILLFLITSCKLNQKDENSKFYFQIAENYFNHYDYNNAIPYYQKYITLSNISDSLTVLSYFHLYYCYYIMSDYQNADSIYSCIEKMNYSLLNIYPSEYYRTKSIYYSTKDKYHEAISQINTVINGYQSNKLIDYYLLAVFYDRLNNFDSARIVLDKAVSIHSSTKENIEPILSTIYCLLGNYEYYYYGNFDKADRNFRRMMQLMENSSSIDSVYYAWNLYSLGVYENFLGHINKSNELFNNAFRIYNKLKGNFQFIKSSILMSQATIDSYLGNYSAALSKANEAALYFQNVKNYYSLSLANTVISNVYFEMGEYQKSLQGYFSVLKLYDSIYYPKKGEIYYSIGRCYLDMNKYDSAGIWLSKSIASLDEQKARMVNLCCAYSFYLLQSGKPEEALSFLNYYYPLVYKQYNGKSQQFIYFLNNKAKILHSLGREVESLQCYQQSIAMATEGNQNASLYNLPDINELPPELTNEVIDALYGKAIVLEKIANNNSTLLLKSLAHYQKAAELAEKYKKSFRLEMDKLSYNNRKTDIYEQIFFIAVQLYKTSIVDSLKDKYYNLAFSYANYLKSNVLSESMTEISLKKSAHIPDSIIKRENEIRQDIVYLQNTIRDENLSISPNKTSIERWQKLLVEKISSAQLIEKQIENEFPLYKQLKYNQSKSYTYVDIQKLLKNKENFIEYQYQNDTVFIFLINKHVKKLFVSPFNKLTEHIQQFRDELTHPSFDQNYIAHYYNYVDLAYTLYEKLFMDMVPFLDGNNLIIVPDKALNYIPFDALISDTLTHKTSFPDYGKLSYLLLKYNINYSYSSHLFDIQRNNSSPIVKGTIAFAPEYDDSKKKNQGFQRTANYREQLLPIPGAVEEAEQVAKIMGGKCIKGKEARESTFRRYTQQGRILHLAMHAIVDDQNPMYSKLAFSPENDSINDGFLNTFELYDLYFSSPLVVLSACNTGYGKLMKGEGLYSLSRGFIYAGCPSIVFTLWQISDKPSKNLMGYFYYHLLNHENIDLSLRNAKIQYIQNASIDMSHPYYWASYSFMGNNNALQPYKGHQQVIFYVSLAFIIIIITIVVIKKK